MTALMANPVALIGIPAVIVCGTVAGLAWWRQKKAKSTSKPEEPAQDAPPAVVRVADANQVHALFRDAENRLKLSPKTKGSSLSTLPVFLVIGPTGTGKTSVILHSGLDPELLAGQVYQGSEVLPTSGLNIWLARQTIFIEVSEGVASEESTMKAVFQHLRPNRIAMGFRRVQAARGILLCADQASVSSAQTPDEVIALARPWNQFLSLAAGTLGVHLPAYVLFTKADALGGFQEFVSNLTAKDLAQAVGATIQPFSPEGHGVYAEDTSRLVTQHFLDVVHCLSDARLPLLNREPDRARVALEYQFPRDFGKLQTNVVQFLVEVARPSQLQVSPFLRGFYFCGTRKVIVERPESAAVEVAPIPANMRMSATTVMSAEQLRTQMSAPRSAPVSRGQREITEWLFLPALFDTVILHDWPAHGASASSLRTDHVRAAALAIAAALGIAFLVALTVSYIRNRELERELISAGKALGETASSASIFSRLEQMRRPVERLVRYRSGPPLSMRLGLYQGEDLLPDAQAGYCTAIRTQVLPPVLQTMSNRLKSMLTGGGDHSAEFSNLKAYMMVTTHPQKAEETLLAQKLFGVWGEESGRAATPEANQLLPAELRLYGALLSIPDAQNYCVNQPSAGAIPAAQDYLRMLNANDRYQSLLQSAGRGLEPVNYGTLFPNDAVGDATVVPGWFTRPGWLKMQELLNHPEDSLKADAWVLGESRDLTPEQLSSLATEYKTRYINDYVKAWKDYLDSAKVAPYANLNDAVAKLEKIAGQHSVLLNLIGLVAKHTVSIDKMKAVFQPASAVVPAEGDFQTAAGGYLEQLNSLKNRLSKAAQSTGPAHDQDIAEVRSAAAMAEDTVDKMALKTFKGETDQIVKAILLKPIRQIDLKPDPAQLIGAAKDLCRAYEPLSHELPFSSKAQQGASPVDVQRIFQPEMGQMWRLYNDLLSDSLDCRDAGCTLKANPKFQLSKGFVDFFSSLNRWSRLLYAVGQDPIIRLQARATTVNHVRQIEMVLGDSRVPLPAGGSEFQPINWDPRRVQKLHVTGRFEDEPEEQTLFDASGPWALFEWFFNAEPGSGGSDGFTWLPRSGTIKAALLKNGNTEKYKLEIQIGDGTARLFDLRSIAVGSCMVPVTK